MKGLMLKDLYMSAKYCRAFLIIVFVFLAVSFFGDENVFFIIYPTMIASIIPVTLISYDERDKWNQYSGTLPYSKAHIVSSKYITGLLFGGSVFILSVLAAAVRMMLKNSFSWDALLMTAVFLLALGVIGPTLLLPFVFKFGAEKGRIAFYVMVGLLCSVGAVLAGIGFNVGLSADSLSLSVIIILAAVLLYALSWRLSILFYQKREL